MHTRQQLCLNDNNKHRVSANTPFAEGQEAHVAQQLPTPDQTLQTIARQRELLAELLLLLKWHACKNA